MKNNLKKPNTFIFESFLIDEINNTVAFSYSFDSVLNFTETITFAGHNNWRGANRALIEKIIFNLHLALGISYYKAYCPKKIVIKSGSLSKVEADFWNKLYTKGLGEFFYQNKLDWRGLINFPYQKNKISKKHIAKDF